MKGRMIQTAEPGVSLIRCSCFGFLSDFELRFSSFRGCAGLEVFQRHFGYRVLQPRLGRMRQQRVEDVCRDGSPDESEADLLVRLERFAEGKHGHEEL